ncbi:MAG: sigma-70 family RNA polymerase sigma factor [Spirochaetes bacterium]|nr:sigma-70 family RNA polymerase sigma factor [Spirochaetota bacterium]
MMLIPLLIQMGLTEDKKPFDAYYLEYNKMLYNFIFKMTRDEEASLDIMQECFARLLAAWDKVGTKDCKSYLFTIGVNLCKDRARRSKHQNHLSLNHLEEKGIFTADEQANHEHQIEAGQFESVLKELIEELPEKQRVVLMMKKMEDMTYEDVFGITGIPVRTQKRMMQKAIRFITDRMEELGLVSEGELI